MWLSGAYGRLFCTQLSLNQCTRYWVFDSLVVTQPWTPCVTAVVWHILSGFIATNVSAIVLVRNIKVVFDVTEPLTLEPFHAARGKATSFAPSHRPSKLDYKLDLRSFLVPFTSQSLCKFMDSGLTFWWQIQRHKIDFCCAFSNSISLWSVLVGLYKND